MCESALFCGERSGAVCLACACVRACVGACDGETELKAVFSRRSRGWAGKGLQCRWDQTGVECVASKSNNNSNINTNNKNNATRTVLVV